MSGDDSLFLTGARVYTADPRQPWATAVVTRGGFVAYAGDEHGARAFVGPRTERIHLPGALAVPGLNDSHIHLSWGARGFDILNLEGVATPPELQERLRAYAATFPCRPWIEGFGLPYEAFAGLAGLPREILDTAVAGRPVYLRAYDWHSAWANTAALERAGIARGAALPPPNRVAVDDETGLATGMLKEKLALDLVARLIPEPPEEERNDLLRRAMRHVNAHGVTSVQNMDGDPARLAQYERLRERGDVTVRAAHYLSVREDTPREELRRLAELLPAYAGPWNRLRGIKLFMDGVVESKTALLLDPYADGSGEAGVPDIDPDAYRDIVVLADALRLAVATHAIGDRAVRLALNAYEAARIANGNRRARRHRIEHVELIQPADVPRFAHLGVVSSMQPLHAILGGDPRATPWTALVGPAREPDAFAWQSLLQTGARLAFGSDWPIVTPDARLGLYAAIARTGLGGEPVEGWQPQQRITLAQALDAYTRGAAYAEGQEKVKGALRAGMLADLTVFARDPFALPPDELPSVDIALTVVDGRVAHRTG